MPDNNEIVKTATVCDENKKMLREKLIERMNQLVDEHRDLESRIKKIIALFVINV